VDVWDAVREERLDLVDRVADLSPRQWDSPSLCAQWRVRDVLATSPPEPRVATDWAPWWAA